MRKKMKKTIIVLTLLLLLLAEAGMAESVLPDGISSALEADGIGADRVMAVLPRIGDGSFFSFVAVQDQRGKNVLYGFSEEASGWKRIIKTEAALQQECPVMLLDRSGTEYDGMNLGIAFSCAENRPSSAETVWEWNPKTGQWMLQAYLRHDSTFDIILETIRVTSDGLSYEGWRTEGAVRKYKGTIQKELRYFTYSVFPKTPEQLSDKLTTAPAIPTGELTAQAVQFTGNRNYAVYSGPGEGYFRGGNGKASVSTNDWIQVFGSENGYILIQYAIGKGHMRFGWIEETALPGKVRIPEAGFHSVDAYMDRDTDVTDDPLGKQAALFRLRAGTRVTWLATMGEWAYIECSMGEPFRGFVPVSCLRTEWVVDLTLLSSGQMEGTMTVDSAQRTGQVQVLCANTDQFRGIGVFDGRTGEELAFSDRTDEDGYYICTFLLPASNAPVLILPQTLAGEYIQESGVFVQW